MSKDKFFYVLTLVALAGLLLGGIAGFIENMYLGGGTHIVWR